MYPPPCDLGLPARYTTWRPGQETALDVFLTAPERFIGGVLPTGFGKSVTNIGAALMNAGQAVYLTSTKALMAQLATDVGDMEEYGAIKGQREYTCVAVDPGSPKGYLAAQFGTGRSTVATVDVAPCHSGVDCQWRAAGCTYFDTLRHALRSRLLVTNYAWWFTLYNRPDLVLTPSLLICDEAHEAPDALAEALGSTLMPKEIGELLKETLPVAKDRTPTQWIEWAKQRATRIEAMLEGTHATDHETLKTLRRWKNLYRSLDRLSHIDPRLLLASDEEDGSLRFDVVWAADYAEAWLFRHVPRVYLTSATFTRHSADLLGIAPADLRMHESASSFPAKRRPVYLLTSPTIPRVDKNITPSAEKRWLIEIDRILASRADRKGIIHCKSYKRRDLLLARSEHRERMVTHGRFDAADRIAAFKAMGPGAILVSPSVTTGYDFPYAQAEYQIICKVPFQDSRDPVTKARTLIDARYPAHQAMQEVIQAAGRIMRAADDQGETFLVDAHFKWFLSKNGDLMPKWFRSAITRVNALPSPPPALGTVSL